METKLLYGLDKSGKYKVWSIQVRTYIDPVTDQPQSVIEIFHGQEGGKIQKKVEFVNEGKNIGRANETTPAQQAEFEAESRYKKQLDKGYRPTKEELTELPLLPMLAADYLKQGHRIEYPCFGSPKMDGVRCLAIRHEDRVELKSRGGKQYVVPHIQQQLLPIMKEGDVWDGELYIHGKYLEEIVSAVKKPNELTPEIEFIIFDMVKDETYEHRLISMQALRRYTLSCVEAPSIDVLEFCELLDEVHMKQMHNHYVDRGYEGCMLRNFEGKYESGKRSADLQKYKEFSDAEFQIVDVVADKDGGAIFVVQNLFAQNQFNVVGGSHEERKVWLQEKESLVGKWITVKYQTLYKDTKIPQFPTLVSFRETDAQGNPLE